MSGQTFLINLKPDVFELIKMSFWVPKKAVRLQVFDKWTKRPLSFPLRRLTLPSNDRTDRNLKAQRNINLQSFKSTPDSDCLNR